jgi:hypothetical protein
MLLTTTSGRAASLSRMPRPGGAGLAVDEDGFQVLAHLVPDGYEGSCLVGFRHKKTALMARSRTVGLQPSVIAVAQGRPWTGDVGSGS